MIAHIEIRDIHEVYRPDAVELHLSKDQQFTRYYARRVKEAGGHYSRARKHDSKRYVHVPITETKLINDLLKKFRNGNATTCVFRGGKVSRLPAWVVVQKAGRGRYLSDLLALFNVQLEQAIKRGLVKDGDAVLAEREARARTEAEQDALESELSDLIETADSVEAFARVASELQELDARRSGHVRALLLDRLAELAPREAGAA